MKEGRKDMYIYIYLLEGRKEGRKKDLVQSSSCDGYSRDRCK